MNVENDDPVGGFSTFLLHRPAAWLVLGGFDEAFNPAYVEDNDAPRRLELQGLPTVKVPLPGWQDNNSSSLENSGEAYQRQHWCLYKHNRLSYRLKWGGDPGEETYAEPFGAACGRLDAHDLVPLEALIDTADSRSIDGSCSSCQALHGIQASVASVDSPETPGCSDRA